ncbi:MAG: ribonuclease P protein component [Acidobacteria bacterium]|nr:ribonuclease P protein component [Acidobacteriota bacterium]
MKASFKPQTLRNSQQFRRVYDQGLRFHTPFFSVFILRNDSGEQRYGITVTRKIGSAVVRNRCKRRLREVVWKYELHDSYLGGFDLVINVKAGLAKADFKQLQEAFSQVMDRFRDFVRKQIG